MAEEKGIVICDDEEIYAYHLMEYLTNAGDIPCPVRVYTDPGTMLDKADPQHTVLLVIAESEYSEKIADRQFPQVLVLNETNRLMEEGIRNVSKYQSIDNIASIIITVCRQNDAEGPPTIRHCSPMKIIGMYTPIPRCLQTTFALTFGELLSLGHRVLYLNFGHYPVLADILRNPPEGTVADLLYYNDCAREKVSAHMRRITGTVSGLDVILPIRDYTQLQKITGEQWVSLFETIGQVSEYEYLILDLSESVQGLFDILEQCTEIDTIRRDDRISRERMNLYEEMLREHHVTEIAARTRYWDLPIFRELPQAPEDLPMSELADYLRDYFQGGERARETENE